MTTLTQNLPSRYVCYGTNETYGTYPSPTPRGLKSSIASPCALSIW